MKPRVTRPISPRKRREGGFALLMVFLMAAIIGIMLYMELPRVAFQSQREKEQLLIERGQQYQIAIRRYMQRNMKNGMNQGGANAWPSKIEDLENTNGRRFLRRRYIDPMTGKDEWRLIHINAAGVLTDSVNTKNNQQDQKWGNGPQGITEFAGLGQSLNNTGAQGVNLVNRKRSSDGNPAGGDSGSGNPSDSSNLPPGNPPAGGIPPVQGPQPGMPGFVPGATGVVGPVFAGQPGQPVLPGQIPQFPGNPNPTNPASSNSGFGGMSGNTSSFGGPAPAAPAPGAPGVYAGSPYPNQGQPGTNPNTPPNVQQMLNNMLTQPRPGGMPVTVNPASSGGAGFPTTTSGGFGAPTGTPMAVPTSGFGSGTIGAGIAGIASTLDADSIMVCGDHTNYHEWEFIFDPTRWKAPADPNTKLGGTPAGSNSSNTPGALNTGSTTGSGSSGFGTPGAGAAGGAGTIGTGGNGQNPTGGQARNQGQNGLNGQNNQGNFGSVCGMDARPGAR